MVKSRKKRHFKWFVGFFLPAFASIGHAVGDHVPKPERITVTVLALSTVTRHGYAGDQTVYLASMEGREGGSQLIRLVDWAESGATEMPSMDVGKEFHLTATRTAWCDSRASDFFLPPRRCFGVFLPTRSRM